MKYSTIVFLLLTANVLLAQYSEDYIYISGTDSRIISFMYAGSDTLEYATPDAGTTKVIIDTIIHKKSDEIYLSGRMLDAATDELLGNKGVIILGSLEYKRKIWLGQGRKGEIQHKEAEYKTEGGNFSVYINWKKRRGPESILFTSLGYGVVDIELSDLISKYFYNRMNGARKQIKKVN